MYYSEDDENYQERKKEWDAIEEAVLEFQKQFQSDTVSHEQLNKSKDAANYLIDKFQPLINKYFMLVTTGQIDWNDKEMKLFVCNFITNKDLIRALKRRKQRAVYRKEIFKNFNFIKETYGSLNKNEILSDLQTFLLILAKRYKQKGRNFCAYVYNSYKFEVCRHIKDFIANPININYKNIEYQDYINGNIDNQIENVQNDIYHDSDNDVEILNISFLEDDDYSEMFEGINELDKRILIKYYLEEWKDKQIADYFGLHINTINQRRRKAAKQIAINKNYDISSVKRTRKSGKKAILPTQ